MDLEKTLRIYIKSLLLILDMAKNDVSDVRWNSFVSSEGIGSNIKIKKVIVRNISSYVHSLINDSEQASTSYSSDSIDEIITTLSAFKRSYHLFTNNGSISFNPIFSTSNIFEYNLKTYINNYITRKGLRGIIFDYIKAFCHCLARYMHEYGTSFKYFKMFMCNLNSLCELKKLKVYLIDEDYIDVSNVS